MIGWKVMRFDAIKNELVSGADSRLTFPAQRGRISMPGQGIWMGLSARYVVEHYSVHDNEALIALQFDPDAVLHGNITDREPEFTVRTAIIRRIFEIKQ